MLDTENAYALKFYRNAAKFLLTGHPIALIIIAMRTMHEKIAIEYFKNNPCTYFDTEFLEYLYKRI